MKPECGEGEHGWDVLRDAQKIAVLRDEEVRTTCSSSLTCKREPWISIAILVTVTARGGLQEISWLYK